MKSRSLLRSPRIHSVRSTAIDKFISHDQTLPPKTFIRTFTHCVRAIRIFSRVSQTKLTKLLQKSRYSMNTRTLASTHSTWRWNGRRSEKNGRTYRIDAVWMRKRSSQFISIEMSIVFRSSVFVCGGGGGGGELARTHCVPASCVTTERWPHETAVSRMGDRRGRQQHTPSFFLTHRQLAWKQLGTL